MNPKSRTSNQVVALLFCSAGIAIILAGGYKAIEGYCSSGWPRVPGVILKSKVFETTTDGRHPETAYVASILYSFNVGGIFYTNHRVSFNNFRGGDLTAGKGIQHRYPLGKVVLVSYCPGKPNLSVLEPGASLLTLSFCFLGLLLIMVGGYGAGIGRKKKSHGQLATINK